MVAEELHFGRAAKRLFMTQPPLSRQIQLLERSLGVTLFERSNRQVRLTIAGRHFLRDARHVLSYSEQAGNAARRLAQGETGRLVMGFTAVAGYALIPGLLGHAERVLPDVQVDLKEMVSGAQDEALASQMIDLGFVRRAAPTETLDYHRVCREPLVVALALSNPLAEQPCVALAALAREPFVMYSQDEGRYFHDCIAGLFATAGLAPRYRYHLGQTHSILGLVRAGLGVALVPAAARELYPGEVAFRPLNGAQAHAELYMVSRRDNDNPALPPFLQMARRYFSDRDSRSEQATA